MRFTTWPPFRRALPLVAAAGLATFSIGGWLLGGPAGGFRIWQALYVAGAIGYFALLAWCASRRHVAWGLIFLAAVAVRVPLLATPPDSDCYRYVWEGRIQRLGLNPFEVAPDDPRLIPWRDAVWERIEKKHYPTIYPPLAQSVFSFVAARWYDPKAMQITACAFDLLVVGLLMSTLRALRRPAWWSAYYAFSPIVLASFAHAGHIDALMLALIVLFVRALVEIRKQRSDAATLAQTPERAGEATTGRDPASMPEARANAAALSAGLFLGVAVLAKTVPAILAAVLWRRRRLGIVVAAAIVILGYLPFADAGRGLFFTLFDFPRQDRFNGPLDLLLGDSLRLRVRNAIALLILAALTLLVLIRPRRVEQDARRLLSGVVLLLPIVHYWYVTWPLTLLALLPSRPLSWLGLTASMVIYWNAPHSYATGGAWGLSWRETAAVWAPFFVLWAAELTFSLAKRRGQPA